MTATTPKKIEIFRPGTFVTRHGDEITFSAADLAAIAASYDPALQEAPIVVGHPRTDDPAQGWVKALEFSGDRLIATVDQVSPTFADAVRRGEYRHISPAFYPSNSKSNPKPGGYYLRHVGCLGAQPPAVSGLKPLDFAADDKDFLEFSQADLPLGDVFRQLRDWLISKFGLDDANAALPSWIVSWAEDNDRTPDPDDAATSPAFSQPGTGDAMTTPTDAARLAELEAREKRLKDKEIAFSQREQAAMRTNHEAFVADLIKAGQLRATDRARTVEFMEALSASDRVIEFSEGPGKKTVRLVDAFKEQLSQGPKLVEFSELAPGNGTTVQSIEFAAPAGAVVDPDRLHVHGQALAYQRQHAGVSYIDAVKAVSKG